MMGGGGGGVGPCRDGDGHVISSSRLFVLARMCIVLNICAHILHVHTHTQAHVNNFKNRSICFAFLLNLHLLAEAPLGGGYTV